MPSDSFSGAGNYSYTVPSGISVIVVEAQGAGGGGGGQAVNTDGFSSDNPGEGGAGGDGALIKYEVSVSPGDTVNMDIGGGGGGGNDGVIEDTSSGGSGGANGGGSGGDGDAYSFNKGDGAGGGGGGWTEVDVNGSVVLVAGGGGGGEGGGAENDSDGSPGGSGGVVQTSNGGRTGANGSNGTGGKGGGGGGEDGGNEGNGGGSLTTGTLLTETAGGANNGGYAGGTGTEDDGGPGGDGAVTISYEEPAKPPNNVAQTVQGNDDILVDWDEDTTGGSPNYYDVQVSEDGGAFTQLAQPTTTSYDYAATPSANEHQFRVRAVNSNNTTAWVTTDTVATDPTALTASDPSSTQIDLSWTGTRDQVEYRILRAQSPGTSDGDYTAIGTVTSASYSDTTVDTANEYYYRVQSVYSGTDSQLTDEFAIWVEEDTPVLGNGVEDEVAVDREATLSDTGTVRLQIRETGESSWDSNATGWAELTVAYDTVTTAFAAREDGEEYEVRARLEYTSKTGAWTSPVSITTQFPGAANLLATAAGETAVDLSWDDNSDNENGFDIERRKEYGSASGPWRTLAEMSPNTETFTDVTAQPARTYQYRILAYTDDVQAYSGTDSATTTDSGVSQDQVPTEGWYVEVDHPNADTPLTPSLLDGVEGPNQVNQLPTASVPIPKRSFWLNSTQLEEQPMRVWHDGERLPIDTLQNVRERPDRVILEGNGGSQLKTKIEQEYVEEEAHVAADEIITATGLAATVDDPTSTVTTDTRMQSGDSQSAWTDRLTTQTDAMLTKAENGFLQSRQTAWFVEAEDADTIVRTDGTLFTADDVASNGEIVNIPDKERNGSNAYVEHTFTTEHAIPAGEVGVAARHDTYGDFSTGNIAHGWTVYIDGENIGSYANNVDTNGFEWVYNTGASSDLQPGEHTIRLEMTEQGDIDPPGVNLDCLSLYDARYPPNYGNSVSNQVLSGDLYPDGVERQTVDATTFQSVVAGELTSAWDDLSGDQAVEISNDQGSNWITAANSTSVSGEFGGGSAQIRARFRLSGYDDDPSTSPAGRKTSQMVDLYDLYADLDDTPLLIDKTYDQGALSALQQIADFGDFIFALRWDSSIDGLRVEWTQPGQRVTDADVSLIDYDTAKINEQTYDRVEIKGQSRSVRDEEVTADVGTAVSLAQSDLVESSGRVAATDGTVYEEGVDYQLKRIPGTIKALSGGSISDGETLEVDYRWSITGSYEASDAPADPKTLSRSIPSIPSERGCEQAALYLFRVVDEPRIEAEATLDGLDPTVSVVDTLTIPGLPTAGEAVELRGVSESADSPTVRLGSRKTLSEALDRVQSQLQAVSRIV